MVVLHTGRSEAVSFFWKTPSIKVSNDGEEYKEQEKSILPDLFPSPSPIIPDGEMTNYVRMGYGSSFDRYQVFRISSGQVIERISMTGAEFDAYKSKKFEQLAKTAEYKKALEEIRTDDSDWEPELIDGFMKSFYADRYLVL